MSAKFSIKYNDEVISVTDNDGNSWHLDYTSSTYRIADDIADMLSKAGADVESREL
jgi:YD repeat-containing protein